MFNRTPLAMAAAGIGLILSACGNQGIELASLPANTIFSTDGVNLSSFDAGDHLRASRTAISGLAAGTTVVGLDMNPNGGALVALGSNGQIYTLNATTAVATPVGSADTATSLANKAVEIDFNPRVQNVFRVLTSSNENYRRNASTGARATTGSSCSPAGDCPFAYATGDSLAGSTLSVSGVAYTSSALNGGTIPASTRVFVIDSKNDVLARLGSDPANGTVGDPGNPNEGQLHAIGKLGIDVSGNTPFDIDSKGNAILAAQFENTWRLFSVNLATGAVADAGSVPPNASGIVAMAIQQRTP